MKTVLVLGDDTRSSLAVIRSLGRHGITVFLGTQEPQTILRYSRYVTKLFTLPDTKTDKQQFISELNQILSAGGVDVVLPCSDKTLVPLIQNRTAMDPNAIFALPSDRCFEFSYRKDKTFELARELGVPVPTTFKIETMEDLRRLQTDQVLTFPLIAKPVSSKVWKEEYRFDLRVRKVKDESSLEECVADLLTKCPVVIQSYFEGTGVGQEFLVRNGTVVARFQHMRVHEPLEGGGSSYRKSVPIDENMFRFSEKILMKLEWNGVVMIEYKQNQKSGESVLIEINGRFWGSLPLAVAAGMDFPFYLFQYLTQQDLTCPVSYKTQLYCRNPAKDIGWFKEQLREMAKGKVRLGSILGELSAGMWNILRGRERWDTLTFDDPLPGIIEFLQGVRGLFLFIVNVARKKLFRFQSSQKSWRESQRTKIQKLLSENPKLLFICRGNICRSPFAEAYLYSRMQEGGLKSIEAKSAGTYSIAGRKSPRNAIQVANEFKLALENHSSCVLNETLMEEAGAILCMDYRDYNELSRRFPLYKNKILFLAGMNRMSNGFEISDPWGKSEEEFRKCYKSIALSVDGLLEELKS